MDTLIGQMLSHFKVVDHLGSGGMGQVYLAEDTRLGRKVALKVLAPEFTQDSNRVRRFEREARAASALNHPNIVTIYDIGESEVGRFIIMELVEGQTLRALTREPPQLELVADLGSQIAEALEVAHGAGIVHRDIKPQNIMLRHDGYVKVLDFGLVRLVSISAALAQDETRSIGAVDLGTPPDSDVSSRSGVLVGTASYMSPEQARGQPVTSASDMFSLGILLYQLATGKHPFEADSPLGFLNTIVSQPPVSPSRLKPEIPKGLEALILQLLEKDPRLRPSAADVRKALAQSAERDSEGVPAAILAAKRHTVGREKEHEQLSAAFHRAASGRGSLICVTGEPGIGKTTLVDDFLGTLVAAGQPVQIARGRCSERLAGSEAYLPFFEALDNLVRGENAATATRTLKLLAPTWYVQLVPLSSSDSSAERVLTDVRVASQERMRRELGAFLTEVSAKRPLLLFFDDLHWADVASIELLAYLATKSDSMQVLVVATFRPSELMLAKHPFLQVKLDLQSRGVCEEIPLDFLSREEVQRYLALEFPEHCFPGELVDLIHRKTEGSPLFMVDLLRHLRDRQMIRETGGRWALVRSISDLEEELPESVRSMIERKIAQLDDEDRSLLTAASVQGDEFDAAVLAEATKRDALDVEERLEILERVHSLVQCAGEREFPDSTLTVRYRFVHALYQNALYSSLRPARRVALSIAAAESLLGLYEEKANEVAADLALLFETGRDFARAADYFLVASQNAARVYANQEAAALARRALANAEKLRDGARHSRVQAAAIHLAQVHQTLSQFEQAIADFELAENAARQAGDQEAEVNAICGSAMSLFWSRRFSETQEQANRALDLARRIPSSVGVASAEQILGSERMCVGDVALAEQYFDRAIPVLKEKGPPLNALDAVCHRAALTQWQLQYEDAERALRWTLEKARELGAVFHILQSLFSLGMAFGNQGRVSEALSMLDEGRRLAERNGDRFYLSRIPNTLGWIHRELLDMDTALGLDAEGVRLARELGDAEAEANSHVNLGHDYLVLGESQRAFEHLRQAEQLYGRDIWFRWRYNIRLQAELAGYWITRGDLQLAASHAATSLQLAEKTLARKHIAWAHKLLGDIAVLEERVEDARREFKSALGPLREHPCPTIQWRILKAAADLARNVKDAHAADQLLGRARTVVQSLADSVQDEQLRQGFLTSRPVRELGL